MCAAIRVAPVKSNEEVCNVLRGARKKIVIAIAAMIGIRMAQVIKQHL